MCADRFPASVHANLLLLIFACEVQVVHVVGRAVVRHADPVQTSVGVHVVKLQNLSQMKLDVCFSVRFNGSESRLMGASPDLKRTEKKRLT